MNKSMTKRLKTSLKLEKYNTETLKSIQVKLGSELIFSVFSNFSVFQKTLKFFSVFSDVFSLLVTFMNNLDYLVYLFKYIISRIWKIEWFIFFKQFLLIRSIIFKFFVKLVTFFINLS